MSYIRVLPRDLFNEAKLLKCVGKVVLQIHDGFAGRLKFEFDGEQFIIEQNDSDASLYVENIMFILDDELITFASTYNCKENWPLTATYKDEEIEVFEESGEFTKTFAKLIGARY